VLTATVEVAALDSVTSDAAVTVVRCGDRSLTFTD
jgi:hypothetical protein